MKPSRLHYPHRDYCGTKPLFFRAFRPRITLWERLLAIFSKEVAPMPPREGKPRFITHSPAGGALRDYFKHKTQK